MKGRGIAPVCAVLAVAAVPACGRTGLDDPLGLGPGSLGEPSAEAASPAAEAHPSSSGGSPGGGESSSDGQGSSSGSDGGNVFRSDEAGAEDSGHASEADGPGPGTVACGAANCDGCCGTDGTCESGQATSACGHGGQLCVECQPELSCNERGTCL